MHLMCCVYILLKMPMYLLVSANPQLSFARAVGHRVATVTMYKYDNRFLYKVSSVFLHKDIIVFVPVIVHRYYNW